MSNFHKPRTFRSVNGCCICRAKSSSSRFTDSKKYENDFEFCFQTTENRSGEICNACVLLVKRWKKLPRGSKKHWSHVVDARAGPGGKSCSTKQKTKVKDDTDVTNFKKIVKRRSKASPYEPPTPDEENANNEHEFCLSPTPSETSEQSSHSSLASSHSDLSAASQFLDLNYWKRSKVCCGTVFKGPINGAIIIDTSLFRPCSSHRGSSSGSSTASDQKRPRADTLSSGSSEHNDNKSPTSIDALKSTSPLIQV